MAKKICTVGVISWCDFEKYPLRFKVFKECIKAFKYFVPFDICKTVIVDNNSSDIVKKYIKSQKFFNTRIILPENIHDIGAYAVLAKICRDNQTEYFLPIENDFVFFRNNFLASSINMLIKTPKCGYVRLLKFKFGKKHLYDKLKPSVKGHDKPNAVRMYNMISDDKLFWAGPIIDEKNNHFYINNWHWMTFGSLIHIKNWDKIFPKLEGKIPAYQQAELIMMKNFQKLRLQTLTLDGGAFSHNDPISMYQTSTKGVIQLEASKIKYFIKNYSKFAV